jgi:hypothetical protein
MRNVPLLVTCVSLALWTHAAAAQGTYRRAELDSAGQLRIVLSTNQVVRPSKDSNQVAFAQIALSADRRVVGWAALYPNCCTSYPIPLKLVLLRPDGGRTVISNELPIWRWAFAAKGRTVVIRQAPVHGAAPVHYELREIRTGRLIATAEANSASTTALPAWVSNAMSRQTSSAPLSKER